MEAAPGSVCFFPELTVIQLLTNSSPLMELESSLSCSQQPATDHCPDELTAVNTSTPYFF
jgi:hypothetical protein